jgi:phosphopantothenoylcysteine decarboxylase / phosphopantothenate---cysteine ligase
MSQIRNKKILIGITGSIAAFKIANWVRNLVEDEAEMKVIMTESAHKFVTPLTFGVLSKNQVYSDMFSPIDSNLIPHITLARENDLIIIAPATANTICRLANGMADDLLSSVVLATRAKVIICPAMNTQMLLHPAVTDNLKKLKDFGYRVIEPEKGKMACDEVGPGRLVEWSVVREVIIHELAPKDLEGQKILVTAGPTREPIDPVRFISNRSTGKMGYAIAAAAVARGAEVKLISGPTQISAPAGVEVVKVTTAEQMYKAVHDNYQTCSMVIKAAAVSDFRPVETAEHKIKKHSADNNLSLLPNKDILHELGQEKKKNEKFPILVGFAAETKNHLEEGQKKLSRKNLDLIVINDISSQNAGFEVDTNKVTILDNNGVRENVPLLSKFETANRILNFIKKQFC